jgi:hypothetical protein
MGKDKEGLLFGTSNGQEGHFLIGHLFVVGH